MAFEALNLPAPGYEQTRQIVGLSLVPAIQRLAPDLPESAYPRLAEAYRDAFIANRAAGLSEPLYAGVVELLPALKAQGWALGIATGKARRGVDVFLERHDFKALFDAAYCADDGPGKPDPHMLNQNMRALERSSDVTIMIGDTSFDMAMARAAGCYAQGVSWGFHTPDEVHAGGAHHVAEDFAALTRELQSFSAQIGA